MFYFTIAPKIRKFNAICFIITCDLVSFFSLSSFVFSFYERLLLLFIVSRCAATGTRYNVLNCKIFANGNALNMMMGRWVCVCVCRAQPTQQTFGLLLSATLDIVLFKIAYNRSFYDNVHQSQGIRLAASFFSFFINVHSFSEWIYCSLTIFFCFIFPELSFFSSFQSLCVLKFVRLMHSTRWLVLCCAFFVYFAILSCRV